MVYFSPSVYFTGWHIESVLVLGVAWIRSDVLTDVLITDRAPHHSGSGSAPTSHLRCYEGGIIYTVSHTCYYQLLSQNLISKQG